MASAIIHLSIAKELLKYIKVDNIKDYYLGAIAPDISKQIGKSKIESHFIINTKDSIPNIDIFVKRYPTFKYNSFDLGYFIHLYADKIWFEDFIPSISNTDSIKLLDGTTIPIPPDEVNKMIYSDYTNVNISVIEKYDLDLSLFYEEFKTPKTIIQEIPIDKLDILINQMGIIIENSKRDATFMFDMNLINNYIDKTVKEIKEVLENY